MVAFREALDSCELRNLGIVVTGLNHVINALSDHCPLLLSTKEVQRVNRHWQFKFEVSWVLEETCAAEVRNFWSVATGMVITIPHFFTASPHIASGETRSFLFSLMMGHGWRRPGGILPCITEVMNQSFTRDFTGEEIFAAVKMMNPLKASGEDELGTLFYQSFWHIFGNETADLCIDLLQGHHDMIEMISAVLYSVILNREAGDVFVPQRGLRQDDPLSPHLFFICSEGLSSLLRQAMVSGNFKGARTNRRAPTISHLLFANDSLIFGEALARSATQVKDNFRIYGMSSGQEINLDKSGLFFGSNVINDNRNDVRRILNVSSHSNPEKYLGLPAVKADGMRVIHWCKWSDLCNLKEDGGLGFRDMAKFNVSILAKQGCRIFMTPTTLVGRLLRAKGLLEKGFRWKVGSGTAISIWNDYWLPGAVPRQISTPRRDFLDRVSDLIIAESGSWNKSFIVSTFEAEEADAILGIVIHDTGGLILGASRQRLGRVTSAFAAEARAAVQALQFAADLGFSDIILEGDSRTVMQKLALDTLDLSEISTLVWEVRRRAESLHACRFLFTPRSGNKAAQCLALDGSVGLSDRFWVEEGPRRLMVQVAEDMRGIQPPFFLGIFGDSLCRFDFAVRVPSPLGDSIGSRLMGEVEMAGSRIFFWFLLFF
ncbi:hypothetical protein F3Y22_tig00116939pilonHSYRG00032 [Hibiscus syriacus]|uniref:RNase H type-1 domain-containing protein n=1 Tax=Hibiscus syriacus TaxID=106335 RepID=A0A6A2WM26_HIBSY|nr:hypothetical protein F3Y22_tig00116939pilonHSYRG00032 [Hibiscus syriacus]